MSALHSSLRSSCVGWLAALLTLSACAQPGPVSPAADGAEGAARPPSRTVVILGRTEGETIAEKGLANPGIAGLPTSPFNAGLVRVERDESIQPYLVVEVPQLNTETWRLLPEGRMETTYQLRPNLVWHDGVPLSAEDFAFAWRIYANPTYGITAASAPMSLIEAVVASDSRTIVIRWQRLYADAAGLTAGRFQALPRHILEAPAQQLSPEAFAAHPFWSVEYVGLGPYRLTRYERGIMLEGEAFDRYVRGRPKIDRLKMLVIPDANTALANMLAGEAHVIGDDDVLSFQQASVLKREWAARGAGTVTFVPGGARRTENQFHPERADPRAILDLRVRRAFAHAVDKRSLNEVVFDGLGIMADTLLNPKLAYFLEVDRSLTKYPYDLRRSESLMSEAGFSKGVDGFYASLPEGKLNWEIKVLTGERNETAMHVMADAWRRAGFEMSEVVFPSTQITDRESRAKFRTMFSTDGGSLPSLGTPGIPTAENRWTGSNRGSWSSADYDRLVAAWETTLELGERNRRMVEMARLYSDELPSTPIWYQVTPVAYVRGLNGPVDENATDIHLWEWTE